ncbi:MAG: phenylalanine--tRNA ligase subunit beta [Bacilli bacterium]
MKITWNWLSEYVDLQGLTPEKVAADLTNAGIPVESLAPVATGVEKVVVGHVKSANPHPNADRLRVCTVAVGAAADLTIVCGAANVAAGQRVPVALIGARLPQGSIGKSTLRGVTSEGMICSASELGLDVRLLSKEQTTGIFVLPGDAPVGESIVEYLQLSDIVMELELTPNRSDCLSLRGVAFEVAALYSRAVSMRAPELRTLSQEEQEGQPLQVEIATDKCTAYAGQVVSGLSLRPSPLWMQMRLLAVGVRPINNIVDITNYVMFEWGQPLHAFDYDAIAGGHIIVRGAQSEETLITLDGQTRMLEPAMTVIADSEKALGLAGVMGGESSEVTASTRAVVIESALFDPLQTRRTGKRLQLRSEAGTRFEKGIDPAVTLPALARAVDLLCAYGGGAIAAGPQIAGVALTDTGASQEAVRQVSVRAQRATAVLGFTVEAEQILSICERLQFAARLEGGTVLVDVPGRRPDIRIEEDLIEEIARLTGYDQIPATMIVGPLTGGELTKTQYLTRMVTDHLIALGMQQVVTYSFVASTMAERIRLQPDHGLRRMIPLLHPLSEERSALRTTMLPSLLEVAEYNVNRRQLDLRLFEIGTVYLPESLPLQKQPTESKVIAGLLTGRVQAPSPHGESRMVDFFDVKGMVETLLLRLGVKDAAQYTRSQAPFLHGGQAADILAAGSNIGLIGKIHQDVCANFGMDLTDVFYFELSVDALLPLLRERLYVEELPRFPGTLRDLALVVSRTLPVAELLSSVRSAAGALLEDVRVFDVYTGEHVGDAEKSVALRLAFRSRERTLADEDLHQPIAAILNAVKSAYGATLRE